MNNPRMSFTDVMHEFRSHGVKMSQGKFSEGIKHGAFPFVQVIGQTANGRNKYLIMRADFDHWAEQYL